MTDDQLADTLKEEEIRDADPCSWCHGTGAANFETLPNWPGVTSVRALVADLRDANAVCERWKAEVLLLRAEVTALAEEARKWKAGAEVQATIAADAQAELDVARHAVMDRDTLLKNEHALYEDAHARWQTVCAERDALIGSRDHAVEWLRRWQRQAGPGHPLGGAVQAAIDALL